jgi:hypothetical protein
MRQKLFIFLVLIYEFGFAQNIQMFKPSTTIYSGIYNRVEIKCCQCDYEKISISSKDNIGIDIINKKNGTFLIKPIIQSWKLLPNDEITKTKLYVIDNSKNILDSINIIIKKLPTPKINLNSYGHGGVGSWIKFDSLSVKSELFDELLLNVKIDSFAVCAYIYRDSRGKETDDMRTLLFEINKGQVISNTIYEKILKLPLPIMLRFGPIYLNVEGLEMIIDDQGPLIILNKGDKLLK